MRILGGAGLWPALFLFSPAFAASSLVTYSTYLPGSAARAIAVDSAGDAYIGMDGSIVKLDPSGAHLLATYPLPNQMVTALALDSSGNLIAGVTAIAASGPASICCAVLKFDSAGKQVLRLPVLSLDCLAVDAAGNIYIAGTSVTSKPPSTAPITLVTVSKLSAAGNTTYSYTFGGSQNSTPRALAVDLSGAVYVAGDTLATDFPVTPGAAQTKFGGGASAPGYGAYGDAFLAKIDAAGSKLLYSTYWGGSSSDVAYALALDAAGNAYMAGATSSPDFPVTNGAFQTQYAGPPADPTAPNPAGDAFVAKFSATGASVWSTYWGGASNDVAYALALAASGDIYFAGTTESFSDYPKAGAFVPTCRQTGAPFVAALDATGEKLIHASGLSGLSYDNGYALALDASGAVYLAGAAASQVFFATPGAAQTAYAAGASDAFAARIDFTESGAGIFTACVLNGASFAAGNTSFFPLGTVAPGEIVSIFGSGLGPSMGQGLQLNSEGAVSTSLAGVNVRFDGIPAPLLYVSAGQINAVVPYGVAGTTTQVSVSYNGQSYGPIALPVAAAVPAIFTVTQTGHGQAAVLNPDGTLNSIANPAARGSVITFYAEGVGAMSPGAGDGSVTGSTLPVPALPVSVSIRGVDAAVEYAGAAPGYVSGLLQVNVGVPASIEFGNLVSLMLTVGNFNSQLDVTVAVK